MPPFTKMKRVAGTGNYYATFQQKDFVLSGKASGSVVSASTHLDFAVGRRARLRYDSIQPSFAASVTAEITGAAPLTYKRSYGFPLG